MFDTPQLRLH